MACVVLTALVVLICAAGGASAQLVPFLVGRDSFIPPTVACVNDDVLNMMGDIIQSDCTDRSQGCNTDTYRCILSDSLTVGPGLGPNINWTISVSASFRPSDNDGRVKVTLNYVDPGRDLLFSPVGFVQLWRLRKGETNAYDYTGHVRQYLAGVGDTTITFVNVTAGKYVAAFWDVGGTREGNGVPETSPQFRVANVFDTDIPLDMFVISYNMAMGLCATEDSPAVLAGCCTAVGGTFIMDSNQCDDPLAFECMSPAMCSYSKFHGSGATVVHRLVGPEGFETRLLQLADFGRVLSWEHRTDQGNLLNAKLLGSTIDPEDDGFILFRHMPTMCCNKPTMLQVRIMYTDDIGGTYESYWQNRQVYPPGTRIDYRIVKLEREVRTPAEMGVDANPIAYWFAASTIYPGPGKVDIVHGMALERWGEDSVTGVDAPQRNVNQIGDFARYEDFNTVGDSAYFRDNNFPPPNNIDGNLLTMVPFRQYSFYANFTEHSNFFANNDYACAPIGTSYAASKNPALFNAGTMADVRFNKRIIEAWFSGCAAGSGTCPCKQDLSDANKAIACGLFEHNKNNDVSHYIGTVSRDAAIAGNSWCGTSGILDLVTGGASLLPGFEGYRGGQECASPLPSPALCIRSCQHWYIGNNYQGRRSIGTITTIGQGAANTLDYVVVNINGLGQGGLLEGTEGRLYETTFTDVLNLFNSPWRGRFGYDTFAISSIVRTADFSFFPMGDTVAQKYALQVTYARFKVVPRAEVIAFQRATFGTPDSIEVHFRVTCPVLDVGADQAQKVGYCADFWRVTNQDGDIILLNAYGKEFDSSGFPGGFVDGLESVYDEAEFVVQIEYRAFDTEIVFEFHNALQPERFYGPAFCSYDTQNRFPLPVKEYTLLPMISRCRTAPPACPYSKQEILCAAFRGVPYIFQSILTLDLPNGIELGYNLVNPRYSSYFYVWDIMGQLVQGFDLAIMPFVENIVVRIYDQISGIVQMMIEMAAIPAEYQNPMIRPLRCVASPNGTCPVTVFDSGNVSGFNEYPFCSPVSGNNEVFLAQRIFLRPPFTFLANIGAVFFNETVEFVDIFIQEEQTKAINVIQDDFLVIQTGFYTMTVRYGRVAEATPCLERYIDEVIVLSSWQPDPLPLEKIPGCNELSSCCYRVPFIVRGNTPDSTDIVNMDNCTDEFLACRYEIVYNPPLTPVIIPPNPDPVGALCLGTTYQLTFRSPADLVANRRVTGTSGGTPVNVSFPNPWRCDTVTSLQIPPEGLSPIEIVVVPGTCTNPGGVAEFTFRYTQPVCIGPLSADNLDPACRRELAFALQYLTLDGQPFVPGATLDNPYIIEGNFTFAYNLDQTFVFPDFFTVNPTGVLPDGMWRVYIWVRDVGSNIEYDDVPDVRDRADVEFLSMQENAQGVRLFRRGVNRPLCPGTSFENPNPIEYDFVLQDTTWNGPYRIVFYGPSGAVFENITLTATEFCFDQCGLTDPLISPCCDTKIRVNGYQFIVDVGTGVFSAGESGIFILQANAVSSGCQATHPELVMALDSLVGQIQCYPTNCFGTRNGEVEFYVGGGTMIPFLETKLVTDSRGAIRRPRYYYNWTTPFGPVFQEESLFQIGAGNYSVNFTDYNGCPAPEMSCIVDTLSPAMTLQIVNFTQPNCTNTPGEIIFEVFGGIGPNYTLYRLSPGGEEDDGSTIFTDSTIVPGEEYTYIVEDSVECTSPEVSFQLDPLVDFRIDIVVERRPCVEGERSGIIRAVPVPAGTGAMVEWFINDDPNVFSTDLRLEDIESAVYTVRARNIIGCTAQATVGLIPVSDLVVSTSRTPPTQLNGVIQGLISGGNGPPYQLEVVPLDNINVIFQPFENSTFFRLQMVPPQWTGIIRVIDRGGCVTEKREDGARIPADIVFEPPPNVTNQDIFAEGPTRGIGVGGWLWAVLVPLIAFTGWVWYINLGNPKWARKPPPAPEVPILAAREPSKMFGGVPPEFEEAPSGPLFPEGGLPQQERLPLLRSRPVAPPEGIPDTEEPIFPL